MSAVERLAAVSRSLHRRGLLGTHASRGVRYVTGKLARQGTYLYRNEQGHVMEADLSDYMERVGFFGAHSARLVRYLREQLRPGDWAIDVGANVGLMTSPMCAAVGPGGRVWAVEPLPRNLRRLHRLRDDNGLDQLEIFPVALGATTATERLRMPATPGASGWGSFVATWERSGELEVPTAPLDDLVDSHGGAHPLRLVKIDVEGFEDEVLNGAARTLTQHRPVVICEFHDGLLRSAGTSARQLLDHFDRLGYRPAPPFACPDSVDGRIFDMLLVPAG